MKYTTFIACALALCITPASGLLLASCTPSVNDVGLDQKTLFAHAKGSPISMACGPGNVAMGDMNNDGKPDIVVSCEKPTSLIVLLNRGDDQFQATDKNIPLQVSPGNMALGDVNGDGKLDLAYDNHDSYAVTLLLGDGKGGLALSPNSPVVMKQGNHPHTHGLALSDTNGDKKLDLVTANNADNDVSVAFGDGRGSFAIAPASPFPVGPSPYPFALGDVNGDGRPDIVATASATGPQRREQLLLSRALTLLLNDGRGGFRATQLPIRTGESWSAAIGDVNGDGKPDIVATHHELNELTVLLGDGRGNFVEATNSPLDLGGKTFEVAIVDANRDGKSDILSAAGESFRVMLGDGRGGFSAPASVMTDGGTWHYEIGDTNGDGKVDLVTSNSEKNSVSVFVGR